METLAIVAPEGAKGDLRVVNVVIGKAPGTLAVLLENSGTDIVRVTEGSWELNNGSGKTVTVAGKALQEAVGPSWVPAGKRRVLTLPVPTDFVGSGATPSARFIAG
jgi:hypothetical protein